MDLRGAKIRNFAKLTHRNDTDHEGVNEIRIPHYQRPYSWGMESNIHLIKSLLDDWIENFNPDNVNGQYFSGSLVSVLNRENPDHGAHQLVDGQQRITTVFLLAYLNFLMQRTILRQAIQYEMISVLALKDKLIEAYSVVFTDNNATFQEQLDNLFTNRAVQDANDDAELRIALKNSYCAIVGFPIENGQLVHEGVDDYLARHTRGLEVFITAHPFRLQYERTNYNESFRMQLSRLSVSLSDQHPLHIVVPEYFERDDYLRALKTITESDVLVPPYLNGVTLDHARETVRKFTEIINTLSFCVIQTGDPDDAYTLFEVLNDRALALTDLDLIKNQFYKKYCTSADEADEADEAAAQRVNAVIVSLEEQWGRIFSGEAEYVNKLTSYFSAVFLTGGTFKDDDKYRQPIKSYVGDFGNYTEDDIKRDFNVYECALIFIKKCKIQKQLRNQSALQFEYNSESNLLKAVSLIWALDQPGVLVGISNCVLYAYKGVDPTFNVKNFALFMDALILNENKFTVDRDIIAIPTGILNALSYYFWRFAIAYPTFEAPRRNAVNVIRSYNMNSNGDLVCPVFDLLSASQELSDWLVEWQYPNKTLKIQILFARAIKYPLGNGVFVFNGMRHALTIDQVRKLTLDHMEPQNPQPNAGPSIYFNGVAREYHVHGLGNMFPLTGDWQNDLSNNPLFERFAALQSFGMSTHWLTTETQDLYNNNRSGVGLAPTEQFFVLRKEYLIRKFKELLVHNF
jgi:hypothetical protein